MLSIGLMSFLIAVPLFSYRQNGSVVFHPRQFNRIAFVVLLISAMLSINVFYYMELGAGLSIYNGLFQVTTASICAEAFILLVGALLIIGWNEIPNFVPEYALIVLFTLIGSTLLMSSSDLVSMFLSVELQSFAVYVLATLYRSSQTATAAGLKYFLLGGLSSALILLGTALIYRATGTTQFEAIYQLLSVSQDSIYTETGLVLGVLLIGVGFLFKVAAAPFHNWAPDVYDGTTIAVTSWLSTMPKISIMIFLVDLTVGFNLETFKTLLLLSSVLSLIIGTVLGLSQVAIKRLLTYSTISHVGFLLLALAICTEESIEAFLFYLVQYSLTNVCVFLVLISMATFPYSGGESKELEYIYDIGAMFMKNFLLALSLSAALFSMAGIPPLVGFFAKQIVLYSAMHAGQYALSLVAIVVSVISASYYLRLVQLMFSNVAIGVFSPEATVITSHIIAIITMFIMFFTLSPNVLFNACTLLALSVFNY